MADHADQLDPVTVLELFLQTLALSLFTVVDGWYPTYL